jgi:hypothetical protein
MGGDAQFMEPVARGIHPESRPRVADEDEHIGRNWFRRMVWRPPCEAAGLSVMPARLGGSGAWTRDERGCAKVWSEGSRSDAGSRQRPPQPSSRAEGKHNMAYLHMLMHVQMNCAGAYSEAGIAPTTSCERGDHR